MDVIAWLLDGDPSIRWQVMGDLTGANPREVAAERSRVAEVGWGARLLSAQDPDGRWGGGHYSPKWTSTTYTLRLLRHLGIDPFNPAVQRGIETLARRAEWFDGGVSYFPSLREGETCVTGMTLALASYFGGLDSRRESMAAWLLGQQLEDGGWNCETRHGSIRSSFNTTILVLEGLLEYERIHPAGLVRRIQNARRGGHDYLLDRKLMRSLTTGEIIRSDWTRFSFPPRWFYDVLRGLDYLRDAGVPPDDRADEAIELVLSKRTKDGRWKLQNHHPGREHFEMEQTGQPSRWNTLRARRVLRWYGAE
ncbi:MAG: prenyltransferase/squalene oxidase repeat-containing protein [Acidimicrobiia bacterium]